MPHMHDVCCCVAIKSLFNTSERRQKEEEKKKRNDEAYYYYLTLRFGLATALQLRIKIGFAMLIFAIQIHVPFVD